MAQSTVKLIVDAQNAIRPLQRVNEQTKALSQSTNKLKGSIDKGNRSLKNTGNAAKTASSGIGTLVGALKPLLAALAVVGTARFVFLETAELETQRKSLEVLTGSIEKTNSIIAELQEFGAVTPFTSSELIEQTKRLKAFGFETEELVDTTKRLSEVAGATGAELTGIATAFGQIRAKGKLAQEENLQLLERGVDITTELKRITGLQGDAFEKAQRQGKIGADLVNQALINLTNEGGAFFGGATAQAETLNGKVSTLQDTIDTLARTIGTELQDEIKGVIDLAIAGVKAVDDLVKRVAAANKVGRPQLVKISMEARKEATEIIREEVGVLKSLLPKNRERIRLLTEEIKNRKINLALAKSEVEEEEEKLKTAKLIDDEVTNTHQTYIGRPPVQNEIIKKDLEIINKLKTQNDEAKKLKDTFDEIGQSVEDNLVQNLTDAIMGAQTLGEALTGVLRNLQRQLIQMALTNAFSGFGGVFGDFLRGIFSSSTSNPEPQQNPDLTKVARGTVIPNRALGATTNVVVNVDASGSSVEGDDQSANQLGEVIAAAVQSEIINQQMSGGLLS